MRSESRPHSGFRPAGRTESAEIRGASLPAVGRGVAAGPSTVRGLLMGSAAMAALLLSPSRGAYAACAPDPGDASTLICEGDVHTGIPFPNNAYQSLIVRDLFTNISPTTGTSGIVFTHNNDVLIDANIDMGGADTATGRFRVSTVNATGVQIGAPTTSPVTVDFTGDIDTTSDASFAGTLLGMNIFGSGIVSLDVTGNVSVVTADIDGAQDGAGATGVKVGTSTETASDVTLRSTGDVVATSGTVTDDEDTAISGAATGLSAQGRSAHVVAHGPVTVTSGDAIGGGDGGTKYFATSGNATGIQAGSNTGNVVVESTQALTVTSGDANFGATVTASAKYYATVGDTFGIAASSSTGTIDVENGSDITVASGSANVTGGAATIIPVGGGNQAEVGDTVGIHAESNGAVTVNSEGALSVTSGDAFSGDYASAAGDTGNYFATVGNTIGIEASGDGGTATVNNHGPITVKGGDATAVSYGATATVAATMGTAAGISASKAGGSVIVTNEGAVGATAGTVTTKTAAATSNDNGLAYGIVGKTFANESGTPIVPGGNVTITTTGDVSVTGGPVQNPYGASSPLTTSAGVLASAYASSTNANPAGHTAITIDGAKVTANGATVVGVAAYGAVNNVVVKNGATVKANGPGAAAHGIVVGGQLYASTQGGTVDSVASSVNMIRVEKDSSVISTTGIAILDKDTVTFSGPVAGPIVPPPVDAGAANTPQAAIGVLDPATNLITATAPNQTTVRIAGTVTGAVAAVSLTGGDDTVILEPGHDVNGLLDGGEGGETAGDTLDLGGAGHGVFDISTVDGDGVLDANDTITNFENYAKIGPSSFKVTGTNTEIALLPLLGGSLFINGSMPNTFIPMSDGTLLGGNGTIGSFTAASGSTLAPGNSIDTLTVTGNGTFAKGSKFQVEIAPDLTNDFLNVKGKLTINGGTIKVLAHPGQYPDEGRFVIAKGAGGRTGKFDKVKDDLPDIDLKASYPGNKVVLHYEASATKKDNTNKDNGPAAAIAAGFAALNFAETLQERGHFMVGHFVPDMPPMNYAEVPKVKADAFKAVGVPGESVVASSGPVGSERPVYYASAATGDSRPGVQPWIGGLFDDQNLDDFDSRTWGIAGGIDATFGDPASVTNIGVALGYTDSNVSVKNGEGDNHGFHVGVSASHQEGPLNVSGAVAYSNFDYDVTRIIKVGPGTVTASGDPDGDAWSASVQASYDLARMFGWTNVSFAPTARLNALSADRDAYKETGAGVLDLQVDRAELDQVLPAIGISVGSTVQVGQYILKPEVQVFYEHLFGDDDVTGTSSIPVAGANFTTTVSAGGRDRLGLGAGLGVAFSDRISASMRYDGSFGEGTQQHRASGAFNVKF